MRNENNYLLVDTEVLPEVFLKVVHAKRLLAQGKAKTMSEAAKLADLSRSAFYKYKDSVFAYEDQTASKITTMYVELVDESGVLSSLLAEFGRQNANILTINQNIPVDGVAPVSVSFRCDGMRTPLEQWVQQLRNLHGVVNIRLMSN